MSEIKTETEIEEKKTGNSGSNGVEGTNGKKTIKTRRLKKKVKTPMPIKKYIWFTGHGLVLVFGTIAALYMLIFSKSIVGRISYRLAMLGAIIACVAGVINRFGLALPSFYTLLASENFQYMILAGFWLVSYRSALKLLPFLLISIMQVSAFFEVKPVLEHGLSVGRFIAFSELVLVFVLFLRTLFFRSTAGFQLVAFCVFYWLRILFSPETQALFRLLLSKLDTHVTKLNNPKVNKVWEKVKTSLARKKDENDMLFESIH